MNSDDLLGQFNLRFGEALKEEGQARAESTRAEIVEAARDLAKEIALSRVDRCITVDAVYSVLQKQGYNIKILGKAAGCIFKDSCWEFTGQYKRSERVSNHAREVKIWQLKA